jgi:hypothetical protein
MRSRSLHFIAIFGEYFFLFTDHLPRSLSVAQKMTQHIIAAKVLQIAREILINQAIPLEQEKKLRFHNWHETGKAFDDSTTATTTKSIDTGSMNSPALCVSIQQQKQ